MTAKCSLASDIQCSNEDWKCPHCGSNNDHFYLDYGTDCGDEECELMHDEDEIVCAKCNSCWSWNTLKKHFKKDLSFKDYVANIKSIYSENKMMARAIRVLEDVASGQTPNLE